MRTPILVALLAVARVAGATVVEPNGVTVPIDESNNPNYHELPLAQFFPQQGENIHWDSDAHTTPATFSPLCDFTATYLLNQSAWQLGIGWYNVDPAAAAPPPTSQIYVIIPAGSPIGTTATAATIRGNPNYKGGLVGFALVGQQTHFTEQKWNPVCSGCANPGPWALALMYQSTKLPNSYYVAFEDGPVSSTSFNNDGDYNDDVFLLSGLACAGAGKPCSTGKMGVCGDGLTNCDASGAISCVQTSQPATETCNGLDDDCNGSVDDGAMCPAGQVCDRGRCVVPCGASEFGCPDPLVCDNGVCIESTCVGVMCPAGKVCHGGTCAAACDGVTCPHTQSCRAGRCIDPCAGVTCPKNTVCAAGVCVESCACQPCGGGLACQTSSGICVDSACLMTTCAAGQFCGGGMCQDDCTGAVCPIGQTCKMGNCVDLPPAPDMGGGMMGGGGDGGGGFVEVDASASVGDGGAGGASGQLTAGCACAIGSRRSAGSGSGSGLGLLIGLGLGLRLRLRRGRRRGRG